MSNTSHYNKLIIHLRLLKITSDTISLNISCVVSSVYAPTISHLNTYAASKHNGIPIHHVPTISITMIIFVLPPLLIISPLAICSVSNYERVCLGNQHFSDILFWYFVNPNIRTTTLIFFYAFKKFFRWYSIKPCQSNQIGRIGIAYSGFT